MKQVQNRFKNTRIGEFVKKVGTIEAIKSLIDGDWYSEKEYLITEVWEMEPAEWNHFKNNLFDEWPFLNGKGGLIKIDGRNVFDVILVRCGDEALVCDAEGYDYPRYVAKFK